MPDPNHISCPHCGQTYAVQPEQWAQYNGRTINCTKCGQPFVVTAPPGAASVPAMPTDTAPGAPGFPQGYGTQTPGGMPPGYPPGYPPYAPYPPYPPGMYGPPRVTSGWAVASLVGGITGFCIPLGGLLGVVGGIIGIVKTGRPGVGGRGMAITGLVLGIISLLIALPLEIAIMLPALNRAREQANRVACAAHMKALGSSLIQYANTDPDHQFPDKLENLATLPAPLNSQDFVCPATNQTPPNTSSVQALASDLSTGTHLSYVYVGRGLHVNASPDTVLVYEPLANHGREGMNVLFADGSVKWLNADEADQVLNQNYNSTQPIRVKPGQDDGSL